MNKKETFKQVATQFFYYWYDADGNNTPEGFDKWWENNGEKLVENLAIHDVVQAKPEKANKDVLAIMVTLVRTLSKLDNNNPDLLLDLDKRRLLKGKETLTEWCKTDIKDILNPS